MKRKNINVIARNMSQVENSEHDQQIADEEVVSEVDNAEIYEALDDSDTDTDEDEGDIDSDLELNEEDSKASEIDSDIQSDNEALDASATDTDEDEGDIDSEDVKPQKSKNEKVKEEIMKRYQTRQGKQLYIRFPHKVPETQEALEEKIRELTPLVVKVHKPRQRHVRFCLVDFATKEDRDNTLKDLKKSIKKGDLKKYVVNIPKTESSDFINELAERKFKSIENKKAKQRLKNASKKSLKENYFTSTVIVLNLPKTASLLQVRELFSNAVDINIKPGKGKINKDTSIAAITLPTTMDARMTVKKKLSLGGNKLIIKFDNQKLKEKHKPKKNKDSKSITDNVVNEISVPKSNNSKLGSNSGSTKDQLIPKKITAQKNDANKSKKVNIKNSVKNMNNVVSGESEPKPKKSKIVSTKGQTIPKKVTIQKINPSKSKKGNIKNTVNNKPKALKK